MKSKQIKGLANKTKVELMGDLVRKQKDMQQLKLDIYQGKEKNVRKIRELNDDIARIMTVIREKQLKEKIKQ